MRISITKNFNFDPQLILAITDPVIINKLFTIIHTDKNKRRISQNVYLFNSKNVKNIKLFEEKVPGF